MKYRIVLSTIIAISIQSFLNSDPVITFFIRPYSLTTSEYAQQIKNHLPQVGTIAHNTLHGLIQPCICSGIFATYAGFLNVSDCNGQLEFPRKQEHPRLHLLITDNIIPIMINGMTIDHWELDTKTAANFYTLEFKQDPQEHLYFWEVNHAPLPNNNIIPLDTIIVFANARDIYLPTGITLADNTPNFVLPSLYIQRTY